MPFDARAATAAPPTATHRPADAAPAALPASAWPLAPGWRRAVAVMRAAVLVAALLIGIAPLGLWLSPDWLQAAAQQLVASPLPRITLDARAQVLVALAMLPGVLATLWLLWRLWQLLTEYLGGRVFSPQALRALRGLARTLLGLALIAVPQRTALVLALTLGNPPGQRQLVMGLSGTDLLVLLVAGLLWLLAEVMAHAAQLAEDNAGFV